MIVDLVDIIMDAWVEFRIWYLRGVFYIFYELQLAITKTKIPELPDAYVTIPNEQILQGNDLPLFLITQLV